MSKWVDKKMYWAWEETPEQYKARISKKQRQPEPPTIKVLDYVILYPGSLVEHKLCIGVWDDGVYTELHRDELESKIKNERL